MKILNEKMVHTEEYAGCVDIITGLDDFDVPDLEFNEEWHTYTYKGKILPSVTTILDKGEYKDVDTEILKYAQDRGTLIHSEIEEWFKSQKEGFTGEFYTFLDIFINNKELFENKAIFDIKTYYSATPEKREKCYEQIKMYADAIEYLTGIKIEQFYMIHLPKTLKGKIIDLTKEFKNKGE